MDQSRPDRGHLRGLTSEGVPRDEKKHSEEDSSGADLQLFLAGLQEPKGRSDQVETPEKHRRLQAEDKKRGNPSAELMLSPHTTKRGTARVFVPTQLSHVGQVSW